MKKKEKDNSTDEREINELISRLERGELREGDAQLLGRLLRLLMSLLSLVQQKNASIKRLKRMIFGPGTEMRASESKPTQMEEETNRESKGEHSGSERGVLTRSAEQSRRRGHGRRKASEYHGARVVQCRDQALRPGSDCPHEGCRGHLYDTKEPSIFIRLTGQPMVGATRYEQEVLRCSACQDRFTARLPEAVAAEKWDATADAAIVLAKYAGGVPCYRLARMQQMCGVPLPESVQFERSQAVADAALPVYLSLRRLAADGEVIYADDTRVRILSHLPENKELDEKQRRGTQTSGMVVKVGERRIVLYASGRRHAGENLDNLLKSRSQGLSLPIQMGDALSANWSSEAETIEAKCLAHARRLFIEIEDSFPVECGQVLDAIGEVYRIESETVVMSASERLNYHQEHSGPVMRDLREWMESELAQKRVEPNSALGKAMRYVLKHFEGLTKFLSVAAAPLDNNPAEQALKRMVLLRKNALFYKTDHGANIGDLLLSLIETCRINQVNVWDYLVRLIRNAKEVRRDPDNYLPWNYPREELTEEISTRAA